MFRGYEKSLPFVERYPIPRPPNVALRKIVLEQEEYPLLVLAYHYLSSGSSSAPIAKAGLESVRPYLSCDACDPCHIGRYWVQWNVRVHPLPPLMKHPIAGNRNTPYAQICCTQRALNYCFSKTDLLEPWRPHIVEGLSRTEAFDQPRTSTEVGRGASSVTPDVGHAIPKLTAQGTSILLWLEAACRSANGLGALLELVLGDLLVRACR